ncbi:LL-diaminopimelate aminotransferase [Priestia koreensis]|uniref:LL-diaminopimelate aminotransferase n=1 Tax=Priestia koreensis TaxID=284581 RepID=UPI003CFE78DD
MKIKGAERLNNLPPYLFAELEGLKFDCELSGKKVFDLSVGDPNFPTAPPIVESMIDGAKEADNHRYPPFKGHVQFRQAVSSWYKRRFEVDLDPELEVLALLGSKEGLSHISLAFLDAGDLALVPNPGYPAYAGGISLAGGTMAEMPLLEENNFFVNVEEIPEETAQKAKIMFINYPNNPTGAVADVQDFAKIVDFAKRYNIIVVHDAAYSEVNFGDQLSPSFLEAPGAKEVGVEFHSLSKTFCMTGWRIGMVVGNAEVINQLAKVKAFVDSGIFGAVQVAATTALNDYLQFDVNIKESYERRLSIIVEGLKEYDWYLNSPKSGYFIWAKLPEGVPSMDFCKKLLSQTGVLVTPGIGFGEYGEGFVRISLNVQEAVLEEAIHLLGSVYREVKNNLKEEVF